MDKVKLMKAYNEFYKKLGGYVDGKGEVKKFQKGTDCSIFMKNEEMNNEMRDRRSEDYT